jgi:hypothetical protein
VTLMSNLKTNDPLAGPSGSFAKLVSSDR